MPGPSTNISNQSPQLMAGQSCAGDMVDKLRSFGANGCLEVVVPDGRTSILTAINLGTSVVTIEQILTDKCDVFYYVPYAPHDCAVKLSAATTMQPLRVAGRYRLCISPPNPDAKIDENSVEQNGASCCAVDVKCQPVAQAAPVVSAVTGIPCPLTAPFSWLGSTYTTLAQFIADVKAQVAGATYNAATCTFTAPTGSVFPSLVVAPVVAALEYCASGRLPDGGFMYVVGDAIDPAATVAVTDCATPPAVVGYIYPSARPTATTQVLACGVGSAVGPLLGYAANRSKCAAECPCPTSAPASTVAPAPPPVVAQKTLCQLTQEAAATVISPSLPTDELFVLRAGECARVTVASIAPAPAPPPVQTQLVANDSPTVNFTQSGTDAHTVTADVIIDPAAGNALVATATGLRVVVPTAYETPLTATDSNTIDFTQTAVGSHSFTGVVKVDPVAGNLIVAGPSGLIAKLTCPPTTAVSTKLCPTDEFVGIDPLTCNLIKYALPAKCKPVFNTVSMTQCVDIDLFGITATASNASTVSFSNIANMSVGSAAYGIVAPGAAFQQPYNLTGNVTLQPNDVFVFTYTILNRFPDPFVDPNITGTSGLNLLSFQLVRTEWASDPATNPRSTCIEAAVNCVSNSQFGTSAHTQTFVYVGIAGPTGGTGSFIFNSYDPPAMLGQAVWSLDRVSGVDLSTPTIAAIVTATAGTAGNYTATPQSISIATTNGPSFWVSGSRHVGLNNQAGATWTGATQITDQNPGNLALGPYLECHVYQSVAYSTTNSATVKLNSNSPGFAEMCCHDTIIGLSFKSQAAPPAAIVLPTAELVNSITAPTCLCDDLFSIGYQAGGGTVTAQLPALAHYKLLFSIVKPDNTELAFGAIDLENTTATATTKSYAVPSSLTYYATNVPSNLAQVYKLKTTLTKLNNVSGASATICDAALITTAKDM